MNETRAMVAAAVQRALTAWVRRDEPGIVFDGVLADLLDVTESTRGFVGEALPDSWGAPYVLTRAATDLAWTSAVGDAIFQETPRGVALTDLTTPFGSPVRTGRASRYEDPDASLRIWGDEDEDRLRITSFLGLPLRYRGELVGMVGLANRPTGYPTDTSILDPLLSTCALLIDAARAEDRRRAAEETLADRERLMSTIVEFSPNGVFVTDHTGRILQANPAVGRAFGWDVGDILGTRLEDVLIPRFRLADRPEGMASWIAEVGPGATVELPGVRRDGTTFPAHLVVVEVPDYRSRLPIGDRRRTATGAPTYAVFLRNPGAVPPARRKDLTNG